MPIVEVNLSEPEVAPWVFVLGDVQFSFRYQCLIADGEYDYCLLVVYLGLN